MHSRPTIRRRSYHRSDGLLDRLALALPFPMYATGKTPNRRLTAAMPSSLLLVSASANPLTFPDVVLSSLERRVCLPSVPRERLYEARWQPWRCL
ncbi:hypothetical protein GY45DRAFT_174416 [Cubamyces sp. BRFM 1775]|nr:hypothetical protein GY45DRAFT_174416 [Cubamyces sp. BRFM 1775]